MANQKAAPQETFLQSLGRKYSAQLSAARKRVFDEWNRNYAGERPPTTRELRSICITLINNPDLIGGPYAPYIFLILRRWLGKTKTPSRPYSAKEIAALVDLGVKSGVSPPEARKQVAQSLGMEVEAVKKDHLRQSRTRRDKPR